MKTPLLENETMLRDGMASHQRGIESVGGHLYLTSQRLVFESHALNVQTGNTIIGLDRIESVEVAWTKLLNLIPLVPNAILVGWAEGAERFIVYERANWVSAIQEAMAAGKLA